MLVVVDVNKPSITECPDLLKFCKSVVVLDHHRQGTETIENATLSYVEPYASSTCEMVSEILQYTCDNIKMHAEEADCMYSGIMIDTNNFMIKTGVRTFEAAAFLRPSCSSMTFIFSNPFLSISRAFQACRPPCAKKKIQLEDNLKGFGSYEVTVKLHPQVTGKLLVKVVEA